MITKKNMIIPIFDYKLTVLIFDKCYTDRISNLQSTSGLRMMITRVEVKYGNTLI